MIISKDYTLIPCASLLKDLTERLQTLSNQSKDTEENLTHKLMTELYNSKHNWMHLQFIYGFKTWVSSPCSLSDWATPSPRSSSWWPQCGCNPHSTPLLLRYGPRCPSPSAWGWAGPGRCLWLCSPRWFPRPPSCRAAARPARRRSPAAAAGSRGRRRGSVSASACAACGTGPPPPPRRPREEESSSTRSSWSGARASWCDQAGPDPRDPGRSGPSRSTVTWLVFRIFQQPERPQIIIYL